MSRRQLHDGKLVMVPWGYKILCNPRATNLEGPPKQADDQSIIIGITVKVLTAYLAR